MEQRISIERMEQAVNIFGSFDENIKIIEHELSISVVNRDGSLKIAGENGENVIYGVKAIEGLLELSGRGEPINEQNVRYVLQLVKSGQEDKIGEVARDVLCVTAKGKPIKAKTLGQKRYVDAIKKSTVTLGIGPAGTGKTYLAVAAAAAAFRAMADAAKADGISLRSVSAYRSYETQTGLYNRYVSIDGKANAERYSARPGYSEHQTGLALDINTASISAHFENTVEYAWLQENCAKFGFMLRYPQDKESITGYRYEPWHYRYVGVETAQALRESGQCLEEYLQAAKAS